MSKVSWENGFSLRELSFNDWWFSKSSSIGLVNFIGQAAYESIQCFVKLFIWDEVSVLIDVYSWDFKWCRISLYILSFYNVLSSKLLQESFIELTWSWLLSIWSTIRSNKHSFSCIWFSRSFQKASSSSALEFANWSSCWHENTLIAFWVWWVESMAYFIIKGEKVFVIPLFLAILVGEHDVFHFLW